MNTLPSFYRNNAKRSALDWIEVSIFWHKMTRDVYVDNKKNSL